TSPSPEASHAVTAAENNGGKTPLPNGPGDRVASQAFGSELSPSPEKSDSGEGQAKDASQPVTREPGEDTPEQMNAGDAPAEGIRAGEKPPAPTPALEPVHPADDEFSGSASDTGITSHGTLKHRPG